MAKKVVKKLPYWVEKRLEKRKLESGTSVQCLEDADLSAFPFVVMTGKSYSVLGAFVCLCTNAGDAEFIASSLNVAELANVDS